MSAQRMPYENQMIAAFIYALGYAARDKVGARPFSINLFQQTPLDQNFGDLIAGYKYCVALEFKRSADEVNTERRKWSEEAIEVFLGDETLCRQADAAHRLVFGDIARNPGLFFCAYRPLLLEHEPNPPVHDASALIEALCAGAKIGLPAKETDGYLRDVARLRDGGGGGPDPDSGGGSGLDMKLQRSTWLAIAHDGEGAMTMMAAASLAELLDLEEYDHHDPDATKITREAAPKFRFQGGA